MDGASFDKIVLLLKMSQVVEVTKETLDYFDELRPLNDAEMLHCIEEHFTADLLYSRTGSTLLALNPFNWMLRAYDCDEVVTSKYQAKASDDNYDDGDDDDNKGSS
jgi:myosin heavy subunit